MSEKTRQEINDMIDKFKRALENSPIGNAELVATTTLTASMAAAVLVHEGLEENAAAIRDLTGKMDLLINAVYDSAPLKTV